MAEMAPRMTRFLERRRAALIASAVAGLMCVGLYWQWLSHEAKQATFLIYYLKLAPHFPAGELDRLAPSADFLVMYALLTGFALAFAVIQWRLEPR